MGHRFGLFLLLGKGRLFIPSDAIRAGMGLGGSGKGEGEAMAE
jgi:hypothetical protein